MRYWTTGAAGVWLIYRKRLPLPPMARFPEAEKRLLLKMICMNCYARNAIRATRCRKCRSKELRPKAKEARKE